MTKMNKTAKSLAKKGRFGDDRLIHVSQAEIDGIAQLVPGGRLPVNPDTGLPEAFLFALLAPLLGAGAAAAPAAAAGLGAAGTAAAGLGAAGAAAAPAAAGLGAAGAGLGAAGTAGLGAAGTTALQAGMATGAQAATTAAGGLGATAPAALAAPAAETAGLAGLGAGTGSTAFNPAALTTFGADKAVPAFTQAAGYVSPAELVGPSVAAQPTSISAASNPFMTDLATKPAFGGAAPTPTPSPGPVNPVSPKGPAPFDVGAGHPAVDIHAIPPSQAPPPAVQTATPTTGPGTSGGAVDPWAGARGDSVVAGGGAATEAGGGGGIFGGMGTTEAMLAASMLPMLMGGGGSGGGGGDDDGPSEKEVRKMKYDGDSASFPGDDYEAGIDDEWEYFANGGPVRAYAKGGRVMDFDKWKKKAVKKSGMGLGDLFGRSFGPPSGDPYVGPGGGNPQWGSNAPSGLMNMMQQGYNNYRLNELTKLANAPQQQTQRATQAVMPGAGYQAGIDPTHNYFPQEPIKMARGGQVPDTGGIAALAGASQGPPPQDDQSLIAATVDAIQTPGPQSDQIIQMFVQQFGEEALQDLIARVQQTAHPAARGTDQVPAMLTPDEFVVDADTTKALGDGDPDAGADKLYAMMDEVKRGNTG